MKNESKQGLLIFLMMLGTFAAGTVFAGRISAQDAEMLQKVADLKQALATNKQAMAQYTWVEQDIISLKGGEKKEEIYNVQLGPDGKPQKTPVDPSSI